MAGAFNYFMLALFWTGVFVLKIKDRRTLYARALEAAGKGRRLAEESFPAKKYREYIRNRNTAAMQKELTESLAYVNNLVLLGREKSISAQLLLTELAEFSKKLSPVYLDMVHSLNLNETEKAKNALYAAMGTAYSQDIGGFLAGWDELPPDEIAETCSLFIETLREERRSMQRKKDEIISDLVYIPAVVNAMLVLFNFIYVALFIQQRDALAMFF